MKESSQLSEFLSEHRGEAFGLDHLACRLGRLRHRLKLLRKCFRFGGLTCLEVGAFLRQTCFEALTLAPAAGVVTFERFAHVAT